MIDWKDKAIAAVVSMATTSGLMWYMVADTKMTVPEAALFGLLICCGMWGMLLCVLNSPQKRDLVLAPFLERYLLKPLENRLREKWLEEGRAQGRSEIRGQLRARMRSKLREGGLDPVEILPPEESD